MPILWDYDWDWDWHHDHLTTRFWPWESRSYALKCPWRRHYWPWSNGNICGHDWHVHKDEPWCHHSCLVSKVTIETGDEPETNGKGTFKVIIDVHHFRTDELVLKVRNNDTILLVGKQADDRSDKGTFCITREFSRKYKLPQNYDATLAKATMSKDGILSIIVPAPPALDDVERVIDIEQTGVYFGSTGAKTTRAIEANDQEMETGKKAKLKDEDEIDK